MAWDNEHVTFDGHVVARTELAILFYIESADEEHWFPVSQCELSDDEASIMVPLWLARKRDLE